MSFKPLQIYSWENSGVTEAFFVSLTRFRWWFLSCANSQTVLCISTAEKAVPSQKKNQFHFSPKSLLAWKHEIVHRNVLLRNVKYDKLCKREKSCQENRENLPQTRTKESTSSLCMSILNISQTMTEESTGRYRHDHKQRWQISMHVSGENVPAEQLPLKSIRMPTDSFHQVLQTSLT